jgi:hypothetical protein
MFRISHKGEGIDDADTIECARGIVQGQRPRRYEVDEIWADLFPSGHTSRQCGRVTRGGRQRITSAPGRALWNAATPTSVTAVRLSRSTRRVGHQAKAARLASPIDVHERLRSSSLGSAAKRAAPASVTRVP